MKAEGTENRERKGRDALLLESRKEVFPSISCGRRRGATLIDEISTRSR